MGPLGDSDRRGSGDESLAFMFVRGSSTGLCAGDPSTGVMSAHVLWKVRRPPSDHRETAGMCQKEHRLREPDMKGPSKLTGRAWAAPSSYCPSRRALLGAGDRPPSVAVHLVETVLGAEDL